MISNADTYPAEAGRAGSIIAPIPNMLKRLYFPKTVVRTKGWWMAKVVEYGGSDCIYP